MEGDDANWNWFYFNSVQSKLYSARINGPEVAALINCYAKGGRMQSLAKQLINLE